MLIDWDHLNAISDGDNEFQQQLINIYVTDTERRISALKEYLSASDWEAFCKEAHTIKGASANVGALVIQNIAYEMEMSTDSQANHLPDKSEIELSELLQRLEASFLATKESFIRGV